MLYNHLRLRMSKTVNMVDVAPMIMLLYMAEEILQAKLSSLISLL